MGDQSKQSRPDCSLSLPPPPTILEGHPFEGSALHNDATAPSLESGDFIQSEGRATKSICSQALSLLKRMLPSISPQPGQEYTSEYVIKPIIKRPDEYDRGYGQVAAYLATHPNFLVIRKHSWLHNRVLLHLQAELQNLEAELEKLDKEEIEACNGDRWKSRPEDPSSTSSRPFLMSNIREKLKEYDDMVLRTQNMQGLKRPPTRDRNNVSAILAHENNIVGSEAEWIRRSDDLGFVSRDIEHSWISGFVEDAIAKLSKSFLRKVFINEEDRLKSGGNQKLHLTSSKRLNALIYVVFVHVAALELLVPLLISYNQQQDTTAAGMARAGYYQMLTIFISTVLFSGTYAVFSTPKINDIFKIVALFCATQVVFLGNSNNMAAVSNAVPTRCAI